MPNHFHAILQIVSPAAAVGAPLVGAPYMHAQNDANVKNIVVDNRSELSLNESGHPQGIVHTGVVSLGKTLGDMVGAFQSIVTVEYIRGVKTNNWQSFHKNYGNAIIGNISFVMTRNYFEYEIISGIIHQNGRMIILMASLVTALRKQWYPMEKNHG